MPPPGPRPPDAASLETALEALGIHASVDVRGALALLIPAPGFDPARLAERATRDAAVAAARELGFANLALELPDDRDGAALPRD